MAKRTYTVSFSSDGGILDSKTFEADGKQDAGAAAAEIAIEMIRDTGYLRAGDCIRVTEGGAMAIPAAYVVEYQGSAGLLCCGIGETPAAAIAAARGQFIGALAYWRRRDIVIRPVGADEASEIIEMLETP